MDPQRFLELLHNIVDYVLLHPVHASRICEELVDSWILVDTSTWQIYVLAELGTELGKCSDAVVERFSTKPREGVPYMVAANRIDAVARWVRSIVDPGKSLGIHTGYVSAQLFNVLNASMRVIDVSRILDKAFARRSVEEIRLFEELADYARKLLDEIRTATNPLEALARRFVEDPHVFDLRHSYVRRRGDVASIRVALRRNHVLLVFEHSVGRGMEDVVERSWAALRESVKVLRSYVDGPCDRAVNALISSIRRYGIDLVDLEVSGCCTELGEYPTLEDMVYEEDCRLPNPTTLFVRIEVGTARGTVSIGTTAVITSQQCYALV